MGMSADQADDLISELGTAEVARRFVPVTYGPPDRLTCMERARRQQEVDRVLAPALAQIERAFGKR